MLSTGHYTTAFKLTLTPITAQGLWGLKVLATEQFLIIICSSAYLKVLL